MGRAIFDSKNRPPFRLAELGIRALNMCARLWYGLQLTDEATCYKMFKTETLRQMNLSCERFEFCPEVTAKAARMRKRIREVPIAYTARTTLEGKKIRLRDGLQAIKELWR